MLLIEWGLPCHDLRPLRRSDLVMWDRQTQSWWQQVTGEAIVGELTARKLARVDSLVLSFSEFRRSHPGGRVLSRDAAGDEARRKTGSGRDYGRNPYTGYDRAATGPLDAFWAGPALDGRLEPKARVAVARGVRPVAYPLDGLGPAAAANETFEGRPIVLLYARGAASALDTARIRDGADVGQAGLFERTLDGRVLTFRASGRALLDVETGTEWTVAGVATSGPLRGRRLRPIEHEVTFWFIWAVFRPDTEVRRVGT